MPRSSPLATFTAYGDAAAFLHQHAASLKKLGMTRRYGVKITPVRLGSLREWRVVLVDRGDSC